MTTYEDYYEHLRKRNRKPRTLSNYMFVIERCTKLLEEYGMETEPDRIGEKEFWCLISNLEVKEQSVRAYVQILNGCIKYLTKKDYLEDMDILWNRPVIERLFIDTDEFNAMYRIADPKERMILMLGAAMGLRRAEIWDANLNDIKDNKLTIRGKGHGRNGLVVKMEIPLIVREELAHYMKWRTSLKGNDLSDGRLIIYQDNKLNIRAYKHEASIWKAVIRVAERAEIKATTHSLRRLFCTELDRNKCSHMVMKNLMRHSSVELLSIYISPNEKENVSELEKMSRQLVKI